ncbi:MAG: hypothetical protein KDB03_22665 [Planctomycetales bacterium]|nr:hypothetical protein [Planctomycetales bacterium]
MEDRRVDGRGAWMAFSMEGRMPGSEDGAAAQRPQRRRAAQGKAAARLEE